MPALIKETHKTIHPPLPKAGPKPARKKAANKPAVKKKEKAAEDTGGAQARACEEEGETSLRQVFQI